MTITDAALVFLARSGCGARSRSSIGITIGSGIFRSPAGIAQKVPNPMLMLGAVGRSAASSRCAARCRSPSSPPRCRKPAGFYAYLREGWGRPCGVSVRLVGARADPRLGARRHRRRLRRVPAAQPRHRSGRALRDRRARSSPAPSPSPPAPTSSAPTSARRSSASRRRRSSRRCCCWRAPR